MNKFLRWMCALCAVCLLLSGLAVAEECGIGEAASRVPTTTTVSVEQAVLPATSAPASKGGTAATPASTGSSTNPLANENSTKGFVYRMYTTVLGREPDAVGFDYWVSKLEKGEDPFEAGKREFKEECGAVADEYFSLGEIYPSPGYTNEIIHRCRRILGFQ